MFSTLSNEDFNSLEWDDQIVTLFDQLDVILAFEHEERDAILVVEKTPITPHAPTTPEEQVEADPTTPTNVASRTA